MGNDRNTQLKYQRYKWTTFLSMYAGYTLVMLNRKAFSFALPSILEEGTLIKQDLGLIASSQNLAYAISKFLGGVLSDKLDVKILFSGGLFLTGLCTIIFTAFESAPAFALVWFLQGFVQGGIWPACAKILKQWVPDEVFGSWYAGLNTTLNTACCLGPLLTSYILTTQPWTASLHLYGVAVMGIAVASMLTLTRCPRDAGLVNEAKKEEESGRRTGRGRGTWKDMLRSPFLWVLCVSYMVVMLARTTALDWAQLYLIDECGQSSYMGSMFITCLELGGIGGSLLAGYAADKAVASSKREDTRGSPRFTVATSMFLVSILSLAAMLFTVNEHAPQIYIALLGVLLGSGLYGPIALYGVMAIEAAPTHLQGTSHAIVGLAANIGAVLAGLPFSYIARAFDWWGAFLLLLISMVQIFALKVLARKVEYKLVPVKKKMQ